MAETLKGKTYQWQKGLCEKYGVYIGTCILEKDQNDFFDTFLLTGPNQNEVWTHRKMEAPSYESYFIKGAGMNNNVFDTTISRIGVVICFDSAKTCTLSTLKEKNPDIVLMAYSYPGLPRYFSKKDRKNWFEVYQIAPEIYAKSLQVPVVVSNKTGRFSSLVPFRKAIFDADFTGGSAIVDQGGNVLARMSMVQTGVLVSKVTLGINDTSQKRNNSCNRKWLLPYNTKTRFMMEINRKIGAMRYRYSRKRKLALKVLKSGKKVSNQHL
jgi:N-carbamoylputrescine amidase